MGGIKLGVYILATLVLRQVAVGCIGVMEGIGWRLVLDIAWPAQLCALVVALVAYPCAFIWCKNPAWRVWVSGLVSASAAVLLLAMIYRAMLGQPFFLFSLLVTFIQWTVVGIAAAALASIEWRAPKLSRRELW